MCYLIDARSSMRQSCCMFCFIFFSIFFFFFNPTDSKSVPFSLCKCVCDSCKLCRYLFFFSFSSISYSYAFVYIRRHQQAARVWFHIRYKYSCCPHRHQLTRIWHNCMKRIAWYRYWLRAVQSHRQHTFTDGRQHCYTAQCTHTHSLLFLYFAFGWETVETICQFSAVQFFVLCGERRILAAAHSLNQMIWSLLFDIAHSCCMLWHMLCMCGASDVYTWSIPVICCGSGDLCTVHLTATNHLFPIPFFFLCALRICIHASCAYCRRAT